MRHHRELLRLCTAWLRDCDCDAVGVDVEAYESYVFHGRTSLPLWLCATGSRSWSNPRSRDCRSDHFVYLGFGAAQSSHFALPSWSVTSAAAP